MDPFEILDGFGGVAKRSELGRRRATGRTIDQALMEGRLVDLGGGWLARADATPAHVAAVRLNATITCVSAARFYGLPVLRPPDAIHLAVPRARGPHEATRTSARALASIGRITTHREPVWSPPQPATIPLAAPVDVLARVLRCQGVHEAAVMVDAALHQGLVTAEELHRTLRGAGSSHARRTLLRCDGRSRSPIETIARLALQDAGLATRAGVVIQGVGEVDLLVEESVVVECDGLTYHSGAREFREDRRRDRALVAQGYVVLRFPAQDVTNDPGAVVRAVRSALVARRDGGRGRTVRGSGHNWD